MASIPIIADQIEPMAVMDPTGRYRYLLKRVVGFSLIQRTILFVMLNPSTADGAVDDPTIRRCIRFAQDWGYTRLEVVNLFAYRATDKRALTMVDDPIGPENDRYIDEAVARASEVILAWGGDVRMVRGCRDLEVMGRLHRIAGKRFSVLDYTADRFPRHPLYVRANVNRQFHDFRNVPKA